MLQIDEVKTVEIFVVFLTFFNFASSQLRVKTMMKKRFLEVNSEASVDQI